MSFIPFVTNLVTVAGCYLPLQTNSLFTFGVFAHMEASLISYTVVTLESLNVVIPDSKQFRN